MTFPFRDFLCVAACNKLLFGDMKISPAQYILSLRMVNAQSLLENTDYKIGEIAEIVGYDNQLYFSRVFRKEYGVSPAQYRKKMEKSSLSK